MGYLVVGKGGVEERWVGGEFSSDVKKCGHALRYHWVNNVSQGTTREGGGGRGC